MGDGGGGSGAGSASSAEELQKGTLTARWRGEVKSARHSPIAAVSPRTVSRLSTALNSRFNIGRLLGADWKLGKPPANHSARQASIGVMAAAVFGCRLEAADVLSSGVRWFSRGGWLAALDFQRCSRKSRALPFFTRKVSLLLYPAPCMQKSNRFIFAAWMPSTQPPRKKRRRRS